MGKKEDLERIGKMADELVSDENADRERLSDFFDKLLLVGMEGDNAVAVAEYVAKIAEAMTRQNSMRLNTIKALKKEIPSEDQDVEDADTFEEIGRPFEEERGGN